MPARDARPDKRPAAAAGSNAAGSNGAGSSGDAHAEEAQPEGYAAALAELDEILAGLEDERLDVDQLGSRVRRAAALVAFCRDRITGARLEVEQILARLDTPSTDADRA